MQTFRIQQQSKTGIFILQQHLWYEKLRILIISEITRHIKVLFRYY